MLSLFSCVRLLVILRTVARQAPLFMGFSRQEYWSGLPCPPSGDLPDLGIEPASPAASTLQADSLLSESQGKIVPTNCSFFPRIYSLQVYSVDFPGGSAVKNQPAMNKLKEMRVQSLSWEDPLKEGMATQSRILAWRIPWTEEPDKLESIGSQRIRHD